MEKNRIFFLKYFFIYVLVFISVLSLCVGISTQNRLNNIKKQYTLIDYNILNQKLNIGRAENAEEARQAAEEIHESEAYRAFMGDPDKIAEYYRSLSNVDGFYLFFSSNDFAIDILCSKLPHFPENYQMSYSYGQGMTRPSTDLYYNKLREKYHKGEDILLQFCCFQIDYRIEGTYYLPLIKGELNNQTINYSDYIETDKPIPIIIGYDLRDLFKLGDIIDASAVFAIARDKVNDYYSDINNSNIKIKIVGILSEDAYTLGTNGIMDTQPINTAIIMPFFDYTAGPYENEVDRNVFINNYKSAGKVSVLTKKPIDEANTEFMKVINEFGLGSVYGGTVVNSSYVVKGVSLYTYEKLTKTVFIASLVLLGAALVGGIIVSVNKKIKKLSIHFLVGADKGTFMWKIILPFIITDLLAGITVNIIFRGFSKFISENFGEFLVKYNIIAYSSTALCAGVGAFIIFIAILKINRTDFSKALKEVKQ